jgi:hypothetical protein
MPHVNPADEEQDVFRDVRSVIRDAFEAPCNENQIDAALNRIRFPLHQFYQFTCYGIAKRIDCIVREQDLPSQFLIAIDERAQALREHGLRELGHQWNIDERFHWRHLKERDGPARDGGGQVTDAFQVGVNFQGGSQVSQIARNRLVKGEQPGGLFIHFDFHGIDKKFVRENLTGQRLITGLERSNAPVDILLDDSAHGEKVSVQLVNSLREPTHLILLSVEYND